MDKIKQYIRCVLKILTSWKFIVFSLGITAVCYYILLNRYEVVVLSDDAVMVMDRITGDNCIYDRYIEFPGELDNYVQSSSKNCSTSYIFEELHRFTIRQR